MCNFFSGIIKYKHKGVWFDIDLDSHSDIMEKFKIKDDKVIPPFLKFEIRPEDGNVFNHKKDNWVFHIDDDHSQDNIPEWFDLERAREQAWKALNEVFKKRFLIGVDDFRTITEGRWFVKDSKFNMSGSSTVKSMSGSSTVKSMSGSSTVEYMSGSSTVESMSGSSTVESMSDSSTVEYMYGSSTVEYMSGSSTVKSMSGSSTVKSMSGSSTVKSMSDSSIKRRDLIITVANKNFKLEYANEKKPA